MSEIKRWVVNYLHLIIFQKSSHTSEQKNTFDRCVAGCALVLVVILMALHRYQSLEAATKLSREGTQLLRYDIRRWRTCQTNRMQGRYQSGVGWLTHRSVCVLVSRTDTGSVSWCILRTEQRSSFDPRDSPISSFQTPALERKAYTMGTGNACHFGCISARIRNGITLYSLPQQLLH